MIAISNKLLREGKFKNALQVKKIVESIVDEHLVCEARIVSNPVLSHRTGKSKPQDKTYWKS